MDEDISIINSNTRNEKVRNFFVKNKNKIILLIVVLFYANWFTYLAPDIPFEFNQKDYDDYFFYIEAHRTNMGDLGNMYFKYVLKSFFMASISVSK